MSIANNHTLYAQWTPVTYLYDNGVVNTELVGGFSGVGSCGFSTCNDEWVGTGKVTLGTSTMTIQGQVSAYGSVFSNNQIDLTNYSTAEITITAIESVNIYWRNKSYYIENSINSIIF